MQFDLDVFRMNLHNGVNIGMPTRGAVTCPGGGTSATTPRSLSGRVARRPRRAGARRLDEGRGVSAPRLGHGNLAIRAGRRSQGEPGLERILRGVPIKLDRPRPPKEGGRRRTWPCAHLNCSQGRIPLTPVRWPFLLKAPIGSEPNRPTQAISLVGPRGTIDSLQHAFEALATVPL